MIAGHCARECVHRTLGGTVGGEARIGDVAVVRSEVDDAGARRFSQQGQGVLAGQEHAGNVDREDAIPLFQRGVFDGLLDLDAGGIDEDVDLRPLSLQFGKGGGDDIFAGDVVMPELDAGDLGCGRMQIRGDHPSTFGGKARADSRANATIAASDESGLAL